MRRPSPTIALVFQPLLLLSLALGAGCGAPAGGAASVSIVSISPIACTRDASAPSMYDCASVAVVAVTDAPSGARLHVELESDLLGSVSLDGWTPLAAGSAASVDVSVQHVAVDACSAGDGLAQQESAGIDDGNGNESPVDVRYNVPITVSCGD